MKNDFFIAKNLSFSYKNEPPVLNGVDFEMNFGEKILLLASKEMGKTTFLSVASSFEENYSGEIFFRGKELKSIFDSEKKFSFLPQTPIFFKKTILKNLEIFLKNNNITLSKNDLIEKFNFYFGTQNNFDINNFFNLKISKLSIFEKRIIAIFRSVLKSPNIIFLDDQFVDLSDEETKLMSKFYENILNKSNLSVIFSIGNETYKKLKKLNISLKFDRIFYLFDADLRFFDNFFEFENNITNINQFEFFGNCKKFDGTIKMIDGEYFLCFEREIYLNIFALNSNTNSENKNENFVKLPKFYLRKMSDLKLKNNDEEDVLFVFQNFEKKLTEKEFFEILGTENIVIFSKYGGERLI